MWSPATRLLRPKLLMLMASLVTLGFGRQAGGRQWRLEVGMPLLAQPINSGPETKEELWEAVCVKVMDENPA